MMTLIVCAAVADVTIVENPVSLTRISLGQAISFAVPHSSLISTYIRSFHGWYSWGLLVPVRADISVLFRISE